jgi:hypothetical protein
MGAVSVQRAASFLQQGIKISHTRSFQTTACLFKATRSLQKPSPRLRNQSNPPAGTVRVKRTYNIAECLPPIALLNSAQKSGALVVEPENALKFLSEFQVGDSENRPGWIKAKLAGMKYHLTT